MFQRVLWLLGVATTQNERAWISDEISWTWREQPPWWWRRRPQRRTPSLSTFLVDSELAKRRHRVFNFAMSTFDNSLIDQKLDLVFKALKFAAKINFAFGFVLRNVQDGSRRSFLCSREQYGFWGSKLVCIPHDTTNLREKVQKLGIVDLCTGEGANTKRKFYKLTNLTLFTTRLVDVPMCGKDSLLPEPLLKNQNVTYLKQIPENLTMKIFAFSEQLLCLYLVARDSRKKHPKFSTFSWTIVGKQIHQSSRVFL